ncbi:MAG: hypothetical protein Q8881_02600 [Sweet potato little leaf phytoplasma]|nr:hypothetical protein [Sweet potato little leaf phytoplasma]
MFLPKLALLPITQDSFSVRFSDYHIYGGSKESVNEKRDAPTIKPPPNAVPFSDEWLAAFEAAGEVKLISILISIDA